ncbi:MULTISPECIES: hypothetical protein [unclassified Bradyrhizobium]|uniref:hypothetical protein n=1 Tax=unclassified Bradyrhizobium TaxID=2631580 RepID=UPI001BA546B3|nr:MULTISPECIES: hypothetical protein [unclassified Bradyrhizobium]MBR1224728.1 hypothetical protein [Bradyrhizobium sp. AUGA SZCCT0176]MBR1299791.1 hypothetical protein [Bradyrhizobium sp. AUGA SZCCT0042]
MGVMMMTVMVVAVVVMAMMMVAMMVMAVVMAVMAMATVPAVATMPVPTSERRAIDRQRGSAQSENCNRRNNELLDLRHSHSPDWCSASTACCDRERSQAQSRAM